MEEMAALVIPALIGVVLVRAMLLPMKFLVKLGLHSACGFICLWLLNWIAPFTGIFIPVNGVTVLIAGFLGLPGIGLMTVLAVL